MSYNWSDEQINVFETVDQIYQKISQQKGVEPPKPEIISVQAVAG